MLYSSQNFYINVSIDTSNDIATFTINGPALLWFGIGFGETIMNGCYSIIMSSGNVEERILGNHNSGSVITPSINVDNDTISGSTRTVIFTRNTIGLNSNYYTFPSTAMAINIIYAYGTSNNFNAMQATSIDTLTIISSIVTTVRPDIKQSSTGALLTFQSQIDGPLYMKEWEVAPAQFGYQKYGGKLEAVLILPTNVTYHKECPKTQQTPEGPEPLGTNPYIHYIRDWFISVNDIKQYILLIDRLDCYFGDKVEHAQLMGASGVIICDWRWENLFTMWMPQDWSDDIDIPSVLLSTENCQILMHHIGVKNWDPNNPQNMEYPAADKINWTIATIEWGLPHTDDRVEYELWTSSNDYLGSQFKNNFNSTAIRLDEAGDTQFTPHMYILNGSHWACDEIFNNGTPTLSCQQQCSNSGRYCAVDPEYDITNALDGINVVQENLRSLCVWEYDKQHFPGNDILWWDYAVLWDVNCGVLSNSSKNFHENCSYAQMDKLTSDKSLSIYVRNKINETGGYGYMDGVNTILKTEVRLKYNKSIYAVPMIRVNEFLMHGNINCPPPVTKKTCMVLDAICAGFINGTQPDICYSTPSPTEYTICNDTHKDCNGTCFGNMLLDACDKCLSISSNEWNKCIGCNGQVNQTYDCQGTCGGHYVVNPCGYCKDTRLSDFATFGVDCNGGCSTVLKEDKCGNCIEESSINWNSCIGCDDIPNSNKIFDNCGNCLLPTDETWNQCVTLSTQNPSFNSTMLSIVSSQNPGFNSTMLSIVSSHTYKMTIILSVCIVSMVIVVLLICGVFIWRKKVLKHRLLSGNDGYNEPLMQEMTGNIAGNVIGYTIGNISGNVAYSSNSNDDIIKSLNENYETDMGHSNENNSDNRPSPINSEIFDENFDENNINYFIGQRLLIEVNKLLYVEATIIDIIDNGQFVIVKYDNYNNKGTEKLHIINDGHRIKPLELIENNLNDDEKDKNENIQNQENEESVIQNDEYNECVVCVDKMPQYACVPCGHYCICKNCKDLINNKCPICQTKCTFIKIFK